jgi:hypothetical protein
MFHFLSYCSTFRQKLYNRHQSLNRNIQNSQEPYGLPLCLELRDRQHFSDSVYIHRYIYRRIRRLVTVYGRKSKT